MNVVAAMPTAANANATSSATGNASNAHGETMSPIPSITARNPAEYNPPRSNAQAISPIAMSIGPIGVVSIASYNFTYLNLKNTLNVASYTAPFIADAASNAGATNAA